MARSADSAQARSVHELTVSQDDSRTENTSAADYDGAVRQALDDVEKLLGAGWTTG